MALNFIRNLWWGGDPDKVNEISGLTLRDIYAVQTSWAMVHADALKNGLELLKRYIKMVVSLIRNLWWGGDPDKVNEISGLTLRDVYAVQTSWAVVHADALKYGLELFKRLFRAEPETKTFFKSFRNMSEEEFSASYLFRAHAINLMASINQAVTHLKQPELVIVMMNKLGESHGRRQVERKHFNVTKVVLVGMLQDLKLSEDVINSWDKCLDFLFEHIFAKLKIF